MPVLLTMATQGRRAIQEWRMRGSARALSVSAMKNMLSSVVEISNACGLFSRSSAPLIDRHRRTCARAAARLSPPAASPQPARRIGDERRRQAAAAAAGQPSRQQPPVRNGVFT